MSRLDEPQSLPSARELDQLPCIEDVLADLVKYLQNTGEASSERIELWKELQNALEESKSKTDKFTSLTDQDPDLAEKIYVDAREAQDRVAELIKRLDADTLRENAPEE